jgi:hypothetical protein
MDAVVKEKIAWLCRLLNHGSPVDQPIVSAIYCLRYPGLHNSNIKKYCRALEQKILGSNPRPSLLRLTPRAKWELMSVP